MEQDKPVLGSAQRIGLLIYRTAILRWQLIGARLARGEEVAEDAYILLMPTAADVKSLTILPELRIHWSIGHQFSFPQILAHLGRTRSTRWFFTASAIWQ